MTETTPEPTKAPQAALTPEQSRGVAAEGIRKAVGGIIGDYVGCPLPPERVAKSQDPSPYSGCPSLNMP